MTDRLIIDPSEALRQIEEMPAIGELVEQLQELGEYLAHIEHGLMSISREVQVAGLSVQMTYRLLIDKGVCTEEEIQQYHSEHVFKPMKEAAEKLQQQIQAAQQAQEAIKNQREEPKVQEPTDDDTTNVLLASEKSGEVIKFPNRKEQYGQANCQRQEPC